jgi:hypothetical protein
MTDLLAPADKIHLAETPPVVCSSCFGQYTGRRHVDFGAAWDGPMVPPDQTVAGGKMVSVDDLVVCEDCLRFAAQLIGLGDVGERDERIERLNERLTDTGQRLGKALEANEKLREAISAQEHVEGPRRGRPPKPKA